MCDMKTNDMCCSVQTVEISPGMRCSDDEVFTLHGYDDNKADLTAQPQPRPHPSYILCCQHNCRYYSRQTPSDVVDHRHDDDTELIIFTDGGAVPDNDVKTLTFAADGTNDGRAPCLSPPLMHFRRLSSTPSVAAEHSGSL